MVHIYSSKNRDILLYVIKDSVMEPCQLFAAILYVRNMKCSTPYWAVRSRVEVRLQDMLLLDFHATQYGLIRSPLVQNGSQPPVCKTLL